MFTARIVSTRNELESGVLREADVDSKCALAASQITYGASVCACHGSNGAEVSRFNALTDPLEPLDAESLPNSGAKSPVMLPSEEEEPYALAYTADRQEEPLDYLASLIAVDTTGDEWEH